MARTTTQILKEADDTLYTAKLGLQLVKGRDPKARIAGLRNLVVFGRAITNVLQNLRSTVGVNFDQWYQPKVDEMGADRIMKYFYKLRSQILKQGTVNTSSAIRLSGNPMSLMQRCIAPPNAKGFFMGDTLGGCGWEVEIEPGVAEKYYVDVPDNIPGLQMKIDVHLLDAPKEFADQNLQELSEYYISFLSKLVDEAKSIFK